MDRAQAIAQLAILSINVLGVAIPTFQAFWRQHGLTDEEINAGIDAVLADIQVRKKLADEAAGR